MQVTDARGMSAVEIAALMQKKAFDECELSPGVQAGVTAMFGAPLTAAQVVERIVTDVRAGGDGKLLYYTNLIDKAGLSVQNIRVSKAEFAEARQSADAEVVEAIERAIANVRRFHEEQLPKTWLTNRECGAMLGQKVTPVDSVGIYVPGGTAAYPSSVIMNAVPATVAGVPRIVMAVPPGRDGKVNPYGEDSAVRDYSYIYSTLIDWLIEKFNSQKDEGPAEPICEYLKESGYPEKVMVSVGATRYTEYGEKNFLQDGDLAVVVVYPEDKYSKEDIIKGVENNSLNDDAVSVLAQKVEL